MAETWIWAVVGAAGIWCIEASYLPQLLRLWRTKQSDDISPFFPALNLLGRLLAMVYTVSLGESVLAVGFLVGAVFRLTFLIQVLAYRSPRVESTALRTTSLEGVS